MPKISCYNAVLETLRAESQREFGLVHLQLETGYSVTHLTRTVEKLETDGHLVSRGQGHSATFRYKGQPEAMDSEHMMWLLRCVEVNTGNGKRTICHPEDGSPYKTRIPERLLLSDYVKRAHDGYVPTDKGRKAVVNLVAAFKEGDRFGVGM